ncbi:hypothetical protein FQA47_020300 [Oryzias melastigma]|uniref:Uncharacterized protein n=1 Tax=Oryzias melastigma TaxID=30732 RepID=A0A834FKP6_ORYME|nr:hypothetical protein FQA47_020300 [Oryzias melastigma]
MTRERHRQPALADPPEGRPEAAMIAVLPRRTRTGAGPQPKPNSAHEEFPPQLRAQPYSRLDRSFRAATMTAEVTEELLTYYGPSPALLPTCCSTSTSLKT